MIPLHLIALALAAPAPGALPVADFEAGLCGWRTNDGGYASKASPAPTLVGIRTVPASPGRCLEVRFKAGQGWANTYLEAGDLGYGWAQRKAGGLRFRLRGNALTARVQVGVQAWAGSFTDPAFFALPLPAATDRWQAVTVSFDDLQRANTARKLRLPELISVQFHVSGDLPEVTFEVDDIEVVTGIGGSPGLWENPWETGAPRPPAFGLPRIGNWNYPGRDAHAMAECKRLGIGFSSNDDRAVVQQSVFAQGIVTNFSVGRPTPAELLDGLNLAPEDMDQDMAGGRTGEGIESSVFHPEVIDRFCRFVSDRVRARAPMPWVGACTLSSPISMYGEVHYAPSAAGRFAVFSRPAQENYRNWLKRAYGSDPARLAKAWGRPVASWEAVRPPEGPTAPAGSIDSRTEWSDFMHWYSGWLDEVTWRSLQAARKETDKPLAAMIGGPKIGLSQGIAQGNIGPVVRMLGRVKPSFFNDTDSQTLFSGRYTRAACSQYGVKLMLEHVGPPFLEPYHQIDMVTNVLACGADLAHFAHWGELFDDKHWFARMWRGLMPEIASRRTGHVRSDAAMFHSFVTSWYRPERGNGDCVALYDSTNTLWHAEKGYPSWGRALGSPDVVDDTMVEDGALAGRKLLVIPNTGVTVTTRKAADAIARWVRSGGTLVGYGPGCLAQVVQADRSLRANAGTLGLIPASKLGKAWRAGRSAAEARVGKGRVLLYPYPADPERPGAGGLTCAQEAMPELRRLVRETGVRIWCRTDADPNIQVMYTGQDAASGRRLFVADFVRAVKNGLPAPIYLRDRTVKVAFHPSLRGKAELFGITDAFVSCTGGMATYKPETGALSVKFDLPRTLTLRFGPARNGLEAARHPMLLWQNGDLTLRGPDGYGVPQTQEPITVGADGSLTPAAAKVLYLIHGELHRSKFGRGPTFRVTLAKPGEFVVRVNSVTPAGARLTIDLDGKEVLRRQLPDRDGQPHPSAGEYAEDVAVPLPPGEHTIRVDNLGGDWMSVDRYVFRGLR
jgi:hypothetical protein